MFELFELGQGEASRYRHLWEYGDVLQYPVMQCACLAGFGVARNFVRQLREERSLDCRDQLFEEFIEGEFGEWCRRRDGVGLVW